MELLHLDVRLFSDSIQQAARILNIPEAYVEKDYYVFMLLKLMNTYNNELMFKGGTSLSKAWHVVQRFSEDVDLNIKPEVLSTDSSRTRLSRSLVKAYETLGMTIPDGTVLTRREYNTVEVRYNAQFVSAAVNPNLKAETMANKKGKITNATYTNLPISNFVWDAVKKSGGNTQLLCNYGLAPFIMATQNMDVTFVEKCMSLANRYMRGESFRLSRHLYDIYMMYTYGNLRSFDLEETMYETKQHLLERTNDKCLRADKPASIILLEALTTDFYKEDYNAVTLPLILGEKIPYELCKIVLMRLVNGIGLF